MFYIQVSNGLLAPEHCQKIGPAVWVFMWCIDRVTMIDDDGVGWVLGRKPIIIADIAAVLGAGQRTIKRDIARLRLAGYIQTIRTPRGLQMGVSKAKKPFKKFLGNAVHKPGDKLGVKKSDGPHVAQGGAKNGTSNIRQLPKDIKTINNNRKKFKTENPKNIKRLQEMKKGAIKTF